MQDDCSVRIENFVIRKNCCSVRFTRKNCLSSLGKPRDGQQLRKGMFMRISQPLKVLIKALKTLFWQFWQYAKNKNLSGNSTLWVIQKVVEVIVSNDPCISFTTPTVLNFKSEVGLHEGLMKSRKHYDNVQFQFISVILSVHFQEQLIHWNIVTNSKGTFILYYSMNQNKQITWHLHFKQTRW